LRPSEAEPGGWRFDHDPRGSFLGMDFRGSVTGMAAFEGMHSFLSNDPESGFVRTLAVIRRDATGCDTLRGLTLSRLGDTETKTLLDREADWFAALADVFGLTLDDVTPAGRHDLWRRLTEAHERWLAQAT
jgi:arylamine N-acetyltransferase